MEIGKIHKYFMNLFLQKGFKNYMVYYIIRVGDKMNRKGFTLIELIVTIALLAIISLISFVSVDRKSVV